MRTVFLLLLAACLTAPAALAQKGADAWYGVVSADKVEIVQASALILSTHEGGYAIEAGRQRLKIDDGVSVFVLGLAERGQRAPDAGTVARCTGDLPLALKLGPPAQARGGTTTTTTTTSPTISDDGQTTTTTTTTTTTREDGSRETTTTTTTSPADPLGECPTSY